MDVLLYDQTQPKTYATHMFRIENNQMYNLFEAKYT